MKRHIGKYGKSSDFNIDSTEWSEIPIVFVVSFVLSATPQTGGNGQGI